MKKSREDQLKERQRREFLQFQRAIAKKKAEKMVDLWAQFQTQRRTTGVRPESLRNEEKEVGTDPLQLVAWRFVDAFMARRSYASEQMKALLVHCFFEGGKPSDFQPRFTQVAEIETANRIDVDPKSASFGKETGEVVEVGKRVAEYPMVLPDELRAFGWTGSRFVEASVRMFMKDLADAILSENFTADLGEESD